MNCQLPTALSVQQWMGHFQAIENQGPRGEFSPESSGIPDQSGFEKGLSSD
jgi:hypothetical protein